MPDVFSTTQDLTTNVVLDYTSRDFTAIRAQLVGLARGIMPEWTTVGEPSDFGTLLLELFAYLGDVMHFYIDRTASEAFLGTAVRRQSVLYIADMRRAVMGRLFATPVDTIYPGDVLSDAEVAQAGMVYRWVPAGVTVIPHIDVFYPDDLRSPPINNVGTDTLGYYPDDPNGVPNPWV